METRKKRLGGKELIQSYISQINWDWLFLKGLLIFAGIFLLGLIGFLLWFLQ